jgi:hypothetical protein
MSSVSRSVYQKLKEENKRLVNDLFVITMNPLTLESIQVRQKWCKKFTEEREFNAMLKEVCTKYLKEHPEYDITKYKKP